MLCVVVGGQSLFATEYDQYTLDFPPGFDQYTLDFPPRFDQYTLVVSYMRVTVYVRAG